MGFYHPHNGKILFDGVPIEMISLVSLRDKISIVSQNTFLFSDTIRNNILYSSPKAAKCDFENAIMSTGVIDFAEKLPNGLDTEIGERGICLSGGERQKISIARAILKKSDILIFDEATTYLDKPSICFIGDMIEKRFKDKTCLVISHQPNELLKIDRIIWVEKGKLRDMPLVEKTKKHFNVTKTTSLLGGQK